MKLIKLDGYIENFSDMTSDEFLDDFLAYIESKGCYYCGSFNDEDEILELPKVPEPEIRIESMFDVKYINNKEEK